MHLKRLPLAAACTLALTAQAAWSQPFSSLDARSMAMGGVGVAVATPQTAPIFNPALLAAGREGDDVSLSLGLGARVANYEDAEDAIDTAQDDMDRIDQLINNVEATAGSFQALADETSALNASLVQTSDEPVHLEAGAGVVVAKPGKTLGLGILVSGKLVADGKANYRDEALLEALAADAQALADCESGAVDCTVTPPTLNLITVDDPANPTSVTVNFTSDDLQSDADVRGVGMSETGISLAHDFGGWALGVTPKYVRVDTYDYRASVKDADEDAWDDEENIETYHDFNIDLGLVKSIGSWRFGLVGKNLISYEHDTARKNAVDYLGPIELEPQWRAGLSYDNGWMTVALDADLTENSAVGFTDVEGDSQYVSAGVEFDVLSTLQLRAGLRSNLAHDEDSITEKNIASLGVGISILAFHADLAVAGNEDDAGAALELGLLF